MEHQGGIAVKFNPFTAIQRLEMLKQRPYTLEEIANASGIHPNTLARLTKGKVRRVDLDTLEGLMSFFEREGMPVELTDLLVVTKQQAA